jgi:hypothetical protein
MNQPSAIDSPAERRALWFALLGGAVAWLVHFLIIYLIGEFGCIAGLDRFGLAGISGVALAVLGITLPMLALAGLATLTALRRARPGGDRTGDTPGPAHYMAHVGLWSNLLFILIIVVQTIPVFYYLRTC